MTGKLPPTASVAVPAAGVKLYAPAAERNVDALCNMLRVHAPKTGRALEIASGTGQHIVAFAATLPDLHWQPSEPDTARRASIDAYVAEAGLTNVAPAIALDATQPGWHRAHADLDLILLANLLHLIPDVAVQRLMTEAASALAQGGVLMLYGPFRRDGALTSPGDITFDAELRAADPAIGYKDTIDMASWLGDVGLSPSDPVEMPANNLVIIARKF